MHLLVVLVAGCNSVLGIDVPTPTTPRHSPEGVAFVDEDAACKQIAGVVKIARSVDEADITGYALYWGAADGSKLSSIAVIPKTGADVTYTMPATPVPAAAAQLLVFSSNTAGESSTSVSVAISEIGLLDISAGQSGLDMPAPTLDTIDSKLLVAVTNGSNQSTPSLIRCALDGTSCTHTDISVGQGPNSGKWPAIAIDPTSKKLLVVTANGALNQERSALFRCDLDGTNCAYKDISAGQPVGAVNPSLVIDPFNKKLIVVTGSAGPPALIRCDLDGSNCASTMPPNLPPGNFPQAFLDAQNQKLVFVRLALDATLTVTRCDLDLANCTWNGVADSTGAGAFPDATLANGNLYITAAIAGMATLFSTDVDGSKAVAKPLAFAALAPTIAYDVSGTGTQTSLDVIVADTGMTEPTAVRCDPKFASCATTRLTTDPQGGSVYAQAVVDAVNHRLLITARGGPLRMFTMCL